MPHDLFGEVVVRSGLVRSPRSPLVVFSVVAHAALLAAVVIVPLLATDALPAPRTAIEFITPAAITPTVIVPPRLPQRADMHKDQPAMTGFQSPARTEAPHGITPESGLENIAGPEGEVSGPASGIVQGVSDSEIGAEAPRPPVPATPVRLHEGIRAPHKTHDVAPVYPALARIARVQGIVIIEATIDAHGNVEAVRVLRSEALLEQAALDAVRQWKFTPSLLNGVPVPVIMTVTVNFTLH